MKVCRYNYMYVCPHISMHIDIYILCCKYVYIYVICQIEYLL